MNRTLHDTAHDWLAAGQAAVLVEVAATAGPAPREAGTRMLVGAAEVAGSVGGGHLELQAIRSARRLLAGDTGVPALQAFALGPALGQCCGGRVTLRYTRLDPAALALWPAERPRLALQLHGAGHVGRAVVRVLAGIACALHWVDERDDAFPPGPPAAHECRVLADSAVAEVARAAPGTCFLVMTHRHDLDLEIVEAVLRRGDFRFLGLIGSRSKRERFVHRLHARGLDDARLARLVCPVGLPGIEGKQPEVIAVAVAAQLLGLAPPG